MGRRLRGQGGSPKLKPEPIRHHRNSRAAEVAVNRDQVVQTSHDPSADLLVDLFANPLAAERPAAAPLRSRIRTRRGSLSRDWACSVAGTPRCDSRPESCRRRAATRRAYRPPAVPRFRDIPRLRRPVRRRSRARGQEECQEQFDSGCAAFACPLPFRLRVNGRGTPRSETATLANECGRRTFRADKKT